MRVHNLYCVYMRQYSYHIVRYCWREVLSDCLSDCYTDHSALFQEFKANSDM